MNQNKIELSSSNRQSNNGIGISYIAPENSKDKQFK